MILLFACETSSSRQNGSGGRIGECSRGWRSTMRRERRRSQQRAACASGEINRIRASPLGWSLPGGCYITADVETICCCDARR
ncbi:hypothetical protein [Sphingomonas sp. Leaf33]|uniref:hypothetical protein n=1 Tax=Sphingomonas sp. Leaf33 TaxID=1736215 RepID=UPI0012E17277|nr:hypothetical protein [Sphingomonas sp. Leaf33]